MLLQERVSSTGTGPDFLAGGGEMGSLMRAHDWSMSSLGWPEAWPQTLRGTVNLMLHSRFPMCIGWGPDLAILYNDAFAGILGARHPGSLGLPLKDVWVRIWDTIKPLVDRTLSGEATFHENLPLTVTRNGYDELAYFTFSFSPVFNENGACAGMFAVVSETTTQVLSDQRLGFLVELGDRLRHIDDPDGIGLSASGMLGQYLGVARAGYGEIDEAQESVSVSRDWTDGSVPSLAGEARILDAFGPELIAELRSGRTVLVEDCLEDSRAGEAYASTWASIGTRALIVVPLNKEGRLRALFYVHEPHPRRWTDAEATLAQDVAERIWDATERARAEMALRASETRLRLAIDAGRMAIWEHDTATDSITGTQELNRVLGYPIDSKLDLAEIRTRYFPGDRERLTAAALSALNRGERYFEAEHRFNSPDGTQRWFLIRAEIVLGPEGKPLKTVGVLLDITASKEAEETLREREAELRAALEAGSLAIFDYDHRKGQMNPSPRLNEMYGYPPDHTLSIADIRARYHPDDVELIWSKRDLHELDSSLRHFDWTLRLLMPDGSLRWLNGRGEYLRDETGKPIRSRGVVLDITERKRWEEHQQLLIHELNHQVKNTLATVQSIASQTLRNAGTTDEARSAIESRLFALFRAHDVLTRENWEGAGLKEIVSGAIAPYSHERENRLHVEGSDVRLSPGTALAIAMALQELATNAVKYGALSNSSGDVHIRWTEDTDADKSRLRLTWTESGGPPVSVPTRRGFGTRLIERSLAQDLNGQVKIDFAQQGIVCTVDAPLD